MQFYTYYILDFMQALSFEKESFISTEPFKGLFTHDGCHEIIKMKTING